MFQESDQFINNTEGLEDVSASAAADTVEQPASKAPYDATTGQKLPWGTKIDGEKVIPYFQVTNNWPHDAATGERLSWGHQIDGQKIISYSQMKHRWPYDATTGEKLEWGAKIDGEQIITEDQLCKRWPYDATTAEKLEWGTKIDGKKVITYSQLSSRWPHDERTGEKLEWGATGTHVVLYHQLNRFRPTDKATGKPLPYGTPLGGNVVTRYVFSQEYTFVGSDKKTYKGENAKARALSEKPNLSFKSKKEIRTDADSVAQRASKVPYDAITGKKLPRGTKIDGNQVITEDQLRKRWPYDATTGEKLEWGTKIDGEKVIRLFQIKNNWPHDSKTGEKLEWGTKIDGKTVIRYGTLKDRWPHDVRTGERVGWGVTGEHIVSYHRLNRIRPTDKTTGKSLPYGTPLGGNVVTRYVFSQEYTFVGSDKKTYKGENAKARALSEKPNLTFKSKKEIQTEKRRAKAIDKSQSVSDAPVHIADSQPLEDIVRELMEGTSAPSAISRTQMSSEDELSLIANSPTLDAALNEAVASIISQDQIQTEDALALVASSPTLELELNALLEDIDTSAPLVEPQAFVPVYSVVTTDTTTSDSTTAKQSKRNGNDTAAIILSPNLLNR